MPSSLDNNNTVDPHWAFSPGSADSPSLFPPLWWSSRSLWSSPGTPCARSRWWCSAGSPAWQCSSSSPWRCCTSGPVPAATARAHKGTETEAVSSCLRPSDCVRQKHKVNYASTVTRYHAQNGQKCASWDVSLRAAWVFLLPWQQNLPWWYWHWYSRSLAHWGLCHSAPPVCGRLETRGSRRSAQVSSHETWADQVTWSRWEIKKKKEKATHKVECFCIGFCFCSQVSGLLCGCREACTLVAAKSGRGRKKKRLG